MISVSQTWKDLQNAIVRPEGFVEITASGITLTKRNFKTFRYSQNGKIDNSVIPTGEIYVEIIKSSTLNYDLDTSLVYQLKFGFKTGGSTTEKISVGYFMIKNKEIPANGLIAKYTFTDNFNAFDSISSPFLLDEIYKGGSNIAVYSSGMYKFNARTLFERLGGDSSLQGITTQIGDTLEACSYGEALQQVALVVGHILATNPTSLYQRYSLKLLSSINITDYSVGTLIQYKKPEVKHDKKIKKYNVITNENNAFDYFFGSGEGQVDSITITIGANSHEQIELETGKYIALDFDHTHFQGDCYFLENYLHIVNSSNVSQTVKVDLLVSSIIRNKDYTFTLENSGEEIDVNSPLLFYNSGAVSDPDITNALTCGALLQQTGALRDVITVPCRIDPRLELFDYISVQLPDGNYAYGYVESFTINFNGAFNGEVSIRVASYSNYTKLDTPQITKSGTTISLVSSIANATSYMVYVDNQFAVSSATLSNFNMSPYLHSGDNAIKVKATATGYIDSDFSNTVNIAERLASPTIQLNNGVLTITSDPNATRNLIYVNNTQMGSTTTNTFDLRTLDLGAGTYSITVKSTALGYEDSNFSNTKTYIISLSAPHLTIDGSIITVEPVSLATGYDIYVDGVVATTLTSDLTLDLTTLGLSAGDHEIKAKAKASGYPTSDFSNIIIWGAQLSVPTISMSGSTLNISTVPNAENYEIYINSTLYATTQTTSYSLSALTTGNYSIKVKATATGYTDSAFSNEYVYRVALNAPTISITNDTLTITAVSLADSYDIYVGNYLQTNTQNTTFDLTTLGLADGGDYSIKVKAKSNIYDESAFSNSQTYVSPLITPTNLTMSNYYTVANATVDSRSTSVEVLVDGVSIGKINLNGGN